MVLETVAEQCFADHVTEDVDEGNGLVFPLDADLVEHLQELAGAAEPEHTLGGMTVKSTRRVLGHLLVRSLVRSHRSLISLLRIGRAQRCTHLFARSLNCSRAHGKEIHL